MTHRLSVVSIFLLAVALSGAAAERRPVTFDDIMNLRVVGSPAISPDGTTVLYTVRQWELANRTEAGTPSADEKNGQKEGEKGGQKGERKPGRMEARTHIHRVAADGEPNPRQLTFGEKGESDPQWSPDGKFISFTAARGSAGEGEDGPRTQIWIMPADGGEAWQLTSAKEGVGAYAWSPDGKSIAFVTRDSLSKEDDEKRKRRDDARVFEGDFRMSHLWTVDVATKKEKRLTEGELTVRGEPSWSPDGRRLTFAAAPTPMVRDYRADVYIVSAGGGDAQKITSNPGPDSGPKWSPDGKTIAYTSAATGEATGDSITIPKVVNSHLMLYDVAARRSKDVSSPSFDVSPGELHWTADSRGVMFTAGVRVSYDLHAFDVQSGQYKRLTNGRTMFELSASADGKRHALAMSTAAGPAEVYVSDAPFADVRRVTDANPKVRDFALGETEVFAWTSTDGVEVEGILVKPVNFSSSKRYPLLVVIHGGPTGAFTNSFRMSSGDPGQHWAGQGWAVLYPNPRGSTNYGEKFMQGNIPDWGGGDYRDIMSGVDALIKRGVADPEKLAVMGWSYGGYMTCWVVSQTDRFKAAMMGAGLSNLASMYGTTDIPGYLAAFFNGVLSKTTRPLYADRSGLTFADRVTAPLLILHGGSDERVPIGQPMEFYRALKDRGKTVELVFYPREGHGLSEYYHQLDRLKRQYEWITRYTLGDGKQGTHGGT